MERTLWVRQDNERRKGRKGRKLPATIRRVGFVNDINHLRVRCGSRFAPLGMAETGGNRRKLPAKTLREKLSGVLLSQPRGAPQGADWRNACGNCGNCHLTFPPGARDSLSVPTNRRTTSSWMVAASTIWAIGTDSLAARRLQLSHRRPRGEADRTPAPTAKPAMTN